MVGILRIIIEVAHHYLQVTLEEACTQTDKQQGCTHSSNSYCSSTQWDREEEITQEHNEDTYDHHLVVTPLVGSHTTKKRQEINCSEEPGINLRCSTCIETEVLTQEQSEDSKHGIVTESLACIRQS